MNTLDQLENILNGADTAPAMRGAPPLDALEAISEAVPLAVEEPAEIEPARSKPALPRIARRPETPTPVLQPESTEGRGVRYRRWLAARNADPDRAPWPADFFSSADPGEAERCRRLWCAILATNAKEGIRAAVRRLSGMPTTAALAACESWIGSRDFMQVCDLAGLDGRALADRIEPLLNNLAQAQALLDRLTSKAGEA